LFELTLAKPNKRTNNTWLPIVAITAFLNVLPEGFSKVGRRRTIFNYFQLILINFNYLKAFKAFRGYFGSKSTFALFDLKKPKKGQKVLF
jgi:hypothetical protein